MAERRKRRQGKARGQNRENPFAKLPPNKIDFTSTTSTTDDNHKNDSKEPIQVANPAAAAEKAKELLKAQRASVNMLTMVKDRIQQLLSSSPTDDNDPGKVVEILKRQGFAVVDDFLNDESTLTELEEEGKRMLDEGGMEVDTANLGTGEYVTTLQGGETQYALCPRMVEFVVSSTKHVPEVFEGDQGMALDTSVCMATLRTFDRKTLKASLSLLTGTEDDNVLDGTENGLPLEVIAKEDSDQRRLSLYYYAVSKEWDESCGGGLSFESGVVPAKRNRLVLFYSDSTKCKTIPWKGKDDYPSTMIGNSIELHLVNKQ